MDIAQEVPETVIMLQGEASIYLQATTTAVWAPRGQTPLVRVHPGREKGNFYGALNLHTGQEMVGSTTVSIRMLDPVWDGVSDPTF
jgi:hypothetical protein